VSMANCGWALPMHNHQIAVAIGATVRASEAPEREAAWVYDAAFSLSFGDSKRQMPPITTRSD
jgi:hypothetical protein